jgi:hypothetical protein
MIARTVKLLPFAGLVITLSLCPLAHGQEGPLYAHLEPVSVDSQALDNAGTRAEAVFSQIIDLGPDVHWVRVLFSDASLPSGSYVRVTSLLDGESQVLDATALADWSYGTAFFNGSVIEIELVAGPQTTGSFVQVKELFVGDTPPGDAGLGPAALCASTDERVASTDLRVGRLLPGKPNAPDAIAKEGWCTAFLIDAPIGENDKVHLTAGHCFDTDADPPYHEWFYDMRDPFVFQVDVPTPSNANCQINHPGVEWQFPVIPSSVISWNRGPGKDWAKFHCARQDGETTYTKNGGNAFPYPAPAIPAVPHDVRVTGCGVDGSTGGASCTCANPNGASNATRQTDDGPRVDVAGPHTHNGGTHTHDATVNRWVIAHQADTCEANSGSPIIIDSNPDTTLEGSAIAIHTHGGCTGSDPGDHNHGTAMSHPALTKAIGFNVIPAVSEWGLVAFGMILLSAMAWALLRRRTA